MTNECAAAFQHPEGVQRTIVHRRFQSFDQCFALVWEPKHSGKHSIAFSDKNDNKYGLKITARHPNWSNVASVAWKFCVAFGCEDNTGEKPKRSSNVKYWKQGFFRTDNYAGHMRAKHPMQADFRCSRSSVEELQLYFRIRQQ